LTAAHCVNDGASQALAFGAAPDRGDAQTQHLVAEFFKHPRHDLAVGRLAQPVAVPGMILNATDLAAQVRSGGVDTAMRVVGYGTTDSRAGYGTKRSGPLEYLGVQSRLRGDMLVVGDSLGAMMCQGDSGGFIGARFEEARGATVMVGVNSSITNLVCSEPGTSGYALRVDRYIDFISGVMAETGESPAVFTGATPPAVRPTSPGGGGSATTPPAREAPLAGCQSGRSAPGSILAVLLVVLLGRPRRMNTMGQRY
jgi:hypothetical protein